MGFSFLPSPWSWPTLHVTISSSLVSISLLDYVPQSVQSMASLDLAEKYFCLSISSWDRTPARIGQTGGGGWGAWLRASVGLVNINRGDDAGVKDPANSGNKCEGGWDDGQTLGATSVPAILLCRMHSLSEALSHILWSGELNSL